jgi:hypothetical protein
MRKNICANFYTYNVLCYENKRAAADQFFNYHPVFNLLDC